MVLLPFHIVAGALGILSGTLALYAVKGAGLHRKSGTVFVISMLVMVATGALLAALGANWATVMQALLTGYLVTTGMLTMRRPSGGSTWLQRITMPIAVAIGVTHLTFGVIALNSATGRMSGYPPPLFFTFGPIALLAAIGDIRVLRAGAPQGRRRLVRHLWRMCVALFIATASFFLGQAKVIPAPLRITPLLVILALFPLAVMLYWLVRLYVRTCRPTAVANPAGGVTPVLEDA